MNRRDALAYLALVSSLLSGCVVRREIVVYSSSTPYMHQTREHRAASERRFHAGDTNEVYQFHTNLLHRLQQLPESQQNDVLQQLQISPSFEERAWQASKDRRVHEPGFWKLIDIPLK